MSSRPIATGTPEAAAALLNDLYIRLRRDLQRWALVTHQTPQPRMGYVGQHLVSVATGLRGGRSGARGDDLKLPGGQCAEIKCCYRVDQLGNCATCGAGVASLETRCPNPDCGSTNLVRKDDSKWLLSPKDEKELHEQFVPVAYYLVLFEFTDLTRADDIDVLIYEVNPRTPGFALCMFDYYYNIRAHSQSAAPFNLWPHGPKLYMMRPKAIYHSIIRGADDSVDTRIFPGRAPASELEVPDLSTMSGRGTFDEASIGRFAAGREVHLPPSARGTSAAKRRENLEYLQTVRVKNRWPNGELADDLARAVYWPRLTAQQHAAVRRLVPDV